MSHVTSKLTLALAGLALASLPVLAGAQDPTTPPAPQQATPTPQQNTSKATEQTSPQHHLDEARKALGSVSSDTPQIAELRRHFTQLESAWRAKIANAARTGAASSGHAGGHTSGTSTGSMGGTTSGTAAATTAGTAGTPEQAGATGLPTAQAPQSARAGAAASDNWLTHYKALGSLLDRLPSASTVSASASADIDPSTRTRLADFRRHIDLFHATAISK